MNAERSRRLTLVVPSLGFGGAERVMSLMADHWADAGHQVTLITLDAGNGDTYRVSKNVRTVRLAVTRPSESTWQAVRNNLRRVIRLRRAIRESRPDHVVSFVDTTNVLVLLATIGLRVGVIVAERIDPARHPIGPVWSWLRRRTYPRCHALVVQTERVRRRMETIAKRRPIYVIPNAVFPPKLGDTSGDGERRVAGTEDVGRRPRPAAASPELHPDQPPATRPSELRAHRIVGMGRLENQKGFDLLLAAFARIAENHSKSRLQILGEGSAHNELQELAKQLGISDRVELTGWCDAPQAVLRGAELFVLSSRYEGFPNALLEAMACGVPVVSFDCPSGPAEIIRHEVDGLLVPAEDVAALAAAMGRVLSDADLRRRLGVRAAEVTDRFSVERFFTVWDAVFRCLPLDSV